MQSSGDAHRVHPNDLPLTASTDHELARSRLWSDQYAASMTRDLCTLAIGALVLMRQHEPCLKLPNADINASPRTNCAMVASS